MEEQVKTFLKAAANAGKSVEEFSRNTAGTWHHQSTWPKALRAIGPPAGPGAAEGGDCGDAVESRSRLDRESGRKRTKKASRCPETFPR